VRYQGSNPARYLHKSIQNTKDDDDDDNNINNNSLFVYVGASGNVIEALCFKPEGRGFDSR
jgi:hypothetical protein